MLKERNNTTPSKFLCFESRQERVENCLLRRFASKLTKKDDVTDFASKIKPDSRLILYQDEPGQVHAFLFIRTLFIRTSASDLAKK